MNLKSLLTWAAWAPAGKLAIELDVTGAGKENRAVTADMKVDNFKLSRNGTVLIPAAPFTSRITSEVQLDPKMNPTSLSNSTIDFLYGRATELLQWKTFVLKQLKRQALLQQGNSKATLTFERITTLLHALDSLPAEQSLAGALDLSINIDGELEKPAIALTADIHPLTFQNGEKTITEESVKLDMAASADLIAKNYTIKDFKLNSKPLTLETSATLLPVNKEQVISAKGTTSLDLALIGELLESFAELKLTMGGVSSTPFDLQASTTAGKWADMPKHSEFATSFKADTIKGYGLDIQSLSLPLQLKDALATIDMKATVNKGELTVKPAIDFTGPSPFITLPETVLFWTKSASPERCPTICWPRSTHCLKVPR